MGSDEQEFERFIAGIVLEMNVYAEGDAITQDDLETIETHAEADGVFGYIRAPERNYLTDEWVITSAQALGWSRKRLAEWATTRDGRFCIESAPHSQEEMQAVMHESDSWAVA